MAENGPEKLKTQKKLMLKKLFGLFNGKIGKKWGKKGIENG